MTKYRTLILMIAICLGINQKVQTESNVLYNLGLENIEALTNG